MFDFFCMCDFVNIFLTFSTRSSRPLRMTTSVVFSLNTIGLIPSSTLLLHHLPLTLLFASTCSCPKEECRPPFGVCSDSVLVNLETPDALPPSESCVIPFAVGEESYFCPTGSFVTQLGFGLNCSFDFFLHHFLTSPLLFFRCVYQNYPYYLPAVCESVGGAMVSASDTKESCLGQVILFYNSFIFYQEKFLVLPQDLNFIPSFIFFFISFFLSFHFFLSLAWATFFLCFFW